MFTFKQIGWQINKDLRASDKTTMILRVTHVSLLLEALESSVWG